MVKVYNQLKASIVSLSNLEKVNMEELLMKLEQDSTTEVLYQDDMDIELDEETRRYENKTSPHQSTIRASGSQCNKKITKYVKFPLVTIKRKGSD